MKFESLGEIPFVNGARLFVANLGGAIVERRLREALLVDAGGEKKIIGDNGIEHAHAAFVEYPQNRFSVAKGGGDPCRDRLCLRRHLGRGQRFHMRGLVRHDAGL